MSSMTPEPLDPRELLKESRDGEAAPEALVALIYDQLHQQAKRLMEGERRDHTLQPTALVHEAYLRILGANSGDDDFDSKAHFFRLAARCMRSVLVDHARSRGRQKRGGGQVLVSVESIAALFEERCLDVLALDEALEQLSTMDPQLARVVELRFFAGLTISEAAETLGVSTPTVERAWRVARAWLRQRLQGGSDEA